MIREDHVAGTATTDVEDRGHILLPAQFALKFLVEAEDGALTGVVDIARTTTAGGEDAGSARVETGQGCRSSGGTRVRRPSVLQTDDIASTSS